MKATTASIAELLGVSRSTVSRALSGHPNVDETLRQKIIQVAAELQYRPNRAAVSMAQSRSIRIGVVLFSRPPEFWAQVIAGIRLAERQLYDYGVTVELTITDISKPAEQHAELKRMADEGISAIVLSPSDVRGMSDEIDRLTARGIPVLLLSSDIPESSRICFIGPDYVQGGRLAGELMGRFLCGRGRVAAITYDDPGVMISQKLTGFREELGEYPDITLAGPYKYSRTGENVYDGVRELLTGPRLDGILMTYGQLEDVARALTDAGRAGEVVLIGYDTSPVVLEQSRRRVVSAVICQEPEQQGLLCINLLYDLLAHGRKPACGVIRTRLEVVMRQNCRYYAPDSLNAYSYFHKYIGQIEAGHAGQGEGQAK